MDPGTRLTLDVEKAVAGGRMLARHGGRVVLVSGAIPGERVEARVARVARGVVYADVTSVLSASPDRRAVEGDIACGGSMYGHIAYHRQLAFKADVIQDAFSRLGRMPLASPPAMLSSDEHGYRMRARLHVRDGRIGFFREGSHELCDAAATRQLAASTHGWMADAEHAIRRHGLTAVAAIDVAENVAGNERACHLELSAEANPATLEPLGEGLVGLSAAVAGRGTVVRLSGTPVVSDVLHAREGDPESALRLRRNVLAFFQGNRFLLEPLVRHVLARVPAGPVVDLYAGVGLFGLSLAASGFAEVTLVEDDPVGGADLDDNAEPFRDRVLVDHRSVESFLAPAVSGSSRPGNKDMGAGVPGLSGVEGSRTSQRSNVGSGFSRTIDWTRTTVLLDPPRTGLSTRAMSGLIAAHPPRIVYVSCDAATLARDARMLVNAGYGLEDLTGIDLFPNTAHVEAVAVFAAGVNGLASVWPHAASAARTNASNSALNSPVR